MYVPLEHFADLAEYSGIFAGLLAFFTGVRLVSCILKSQYKIKNKILNIFRWDFCDSVIDVP